jgi:hypothetical protein
MIETASLKALARLILERDSARDGHRDRVSRRGASSAEPVRQRAPLSIASSDRPASQSAPLVLVGDGEPGLEQPCVARRGRVQRLDCALLHFCIECGRFAAFGYGVHLRAGRPGRWYCGEHRPHQPR